MDGVPRLAGVRRLVAASAFVVAVAVAGCRTAPDMTPFTDATSQLSSSIQAAGGVTCDEIDRMANGWPEKQRAAAATIKDAFWKQWSGRNNLADALLTYSESLTAIVAAGDQGTASVERVGNAFKQLAGTIGIALPPGSVAGVDKTLELGGYLYGLYAKDAAARSLGESMRKMQPSIDETARVLDESLRHVEEGLDAIRDQVPEDVEDSLSVVGGVTKVRTERATLANVANSRRALLDRIAASPSAATLRDDLAALDAALRSQADLLAPFDARKAADVSRLADEMRLVRTAREGLAEWAAAHGRLAEAALSKRPPNVERLVQTAEEIRSQIKSIRNTLKE